MMRNNDIRPGRSILKGMLMLVLLAGLPACRERTDEHIGTVTERQQQRIDELKSVLCSAPNGWRMKYFPNLNSRLNTDITENYKTEAHSLTDVYLQRRMGAGGYNLFLKFREGGEMEVLTDIAYAPADVESHYQPVYQTEIGQAQYGISVSDDLTLFFRTGTMLEELYPFQINATAKFLPVLVSPERILLRTMNYPEPGREWIEMTPLEVPEEQWVEKMNRIIREKEEFRTRSYKDLRQNLKEDRDCVLRIMVTDTRKVVYETSYDFGQQMMQYRLSASYSKDWQSHRKVARYDRMQYELFLKNEQPNLTVHGYDGSTYYTGLGSGYLATENGLEFRPGFKFDEGVVFTEFTHTEGKKEWVSTSGIYTAYITFAEKNKQ